MTSIDSNKSYFTVKAKNRTFELAKQFIDAVYNAYLAEKGGADNASPNGGKRELKKIQIAGTNGKGSTTVMLAGILRAAGYKTGVYTSPSLLCVNERVAIDGTMITDSELCAYIPIIRAAEAAIGTDFGGFERITAAAYLFFLDKDVDFAVMETGLGGRFDTVTAIDGLILSSITSIGLDHTNMLGDTLELIAYDKCGIIREGVPIISHPQEDEAMRVVERISAEQNAPLIRVSQCAITPAKSEGAMQTFSMKAGGADMLLSIRLQGEHQLLNAANAVLCGIELDKSGLARIPEAAIKQGLHDADIAGRLQLVKPKFTRSRLLIDGAHNPHAMRALRAALPSLGLSEGGHVALFSVLLTKDIVGIIKEMRGLADEVICVKATENSMEADALAALCRENEFAARPADSVSEGLALADRLSDGRDIIVTGSLYLVAETLRLIGDGRGN